MTELQDPLRDAAVASRASTRLRDVAQDSSVTSRVGGTHAFPADLYAEGMLWVAQWGGWQVGRYDPRSGKKLDRVDVPAAQVSSCAFGGETLDDLFITTARENLTADQLARQPLAGSLFVAKPYRGPEVVSALRKLTGLG